MRLELKKRPLYVRNSSGDWTEDVEALLDASNFGAETLEGRERLILKPNLVEALKPPITTPVGLIEALIISLRERLKGVEVIVGEGTGASSYETEHAFRELGYVELSKRHNVKLMDLNHAELTELRDPECTRFLSFFLPKILLDSFILSVPVLKAHSLATVTLTMKNMMGAVPPLHYQAGGHWKKSSFHSAMHESVMDLNRYRTPDFTVLDATVGMKEAHLWGPECDPPVGKLVAGADPVAIDAYGALLLKKDWRSIKYIRDADGVLGYAEAMEVVDV